MSEFDAGRTVGEQGAAIESLEKRLISLESKVDELLERVTMARGGLAVLIAIGTVCATLIGAGIMWLHGGKS
jgi:hypothetical protein